jgi:hypothetical protein
MNVRYEAEDLLYCDALFGADHLHHLIDLCTSKVSNVDFCRALENCVSTIFHLPDRFCKFFCFGVAILDNTVELRDNT